LNKDNENVSNQLDKEVDLNESMDTGDIENNSDCSNNESIGEGDFPNTFVQSEEIVEEDVKDDEVNIIEEPINENNQIDYSNDHNFVEDAQTMESDACIENDNPSIQNTNLNNENIQSKVKKRQLIIIVAVILIIGATFIMVKQPFTKKDTTTLPSVSSASPKEEKAMKSILDRLTSYYEPDSNGTLVFKPNVDVNVDDLEKLKKDIEKVKDEGTKKEFLRLFEQLKEDITNDDGITSSIEELSSSSVVSYNVTFNKT